MGASGTGTAAPKANFRSRAFRIGNPSLKKTLNVIEQKKNILNRLAGVYLSYGNARRKMPMHWLPDYKILWMNRDRRSTYRDC